MITNMTCATISALLIAASSVFAAEGQSQRLPMPNPAGDREAFDHWQQAARAKLMTMLGIPEQRVALDAKARGKFEVGGVVIEKWVFTLEPGSKTPAIVYRPKELPAKRLPAVVLTYGHGASKSHPSYQYIGQVLAKMNVICLAIDPLGEEERHKDRRMGTRAHDPKPVHEAAWNSGRPIMGKLVFDTMRGVDFLLTRADVDPKRIGVAGNSLGGAKAGWMAVLDPRIRCAIVSGWAFAPEVEKWGKFCTRLPNEHMRRMLEWHEYLALAAPRCSILVANGDADVIIDREGKGDAWRNTDAAVAKARQAYTALGAPHGIATWYERGGGHRPYPAHPEVLAWICQRLNPPGWTPQRAKKLPRINFGQWADVHRVRFEGLYGTKLHLRGATVAGLDVHYLPPDKLRALKPEEVGRPEFTIEGWLEQIQRPITYTNPIVRGDWSDPAVICVGEDYYSVCSTNHWQPGIPIIHSKDLVHWRYIGNAFRSNPHLRPGETGGGVYGLEMGYNPHTKMFLIYAPLANRELYVYYAPRPEGPYKVKHIGRLGIDPGFFVDTDGRLYLVMYKGEIYELEKDGLSVKRLVTKIDTRRYKFFEGPDIFKRGDWYYCLYSDGGTRPHQPSTISVLRSRRIEGPWKEDPGNPVMSATDDGSPLQGPAHGTLIETQQGEWFITFHAHELSHYSLGRPMCMDRIKWNDNGWWRPRHGKAPRVTNVAPKLPARDYALAQSDEFESKKLAPQWFFHTRPAKQGSGWSLTERPGWLRIHPRAGKPIEKAVLPAVFLQRVTDKRFRLATRVAFDAAAPGHAAGLCMYHDPGMNFWLATTHRDGNRAIEVGKTNHGQRKMLWTVENKIGAEVHLRIDVDGEESATFYYGSDGKQWTRLGGSIYFGDSWRDLRNGRGGNPDLGWIGIKKRNAWSAAALGVFAVHAADTKPTPADFEFVKIRTPKQQDVSNAGPRRADFGGSRSRPPLGSLAELLDADSIPRVKPWWTRQASSGLIDRFEDYGNFVRQESGRRYVLMDAKGAGCIDRFWCVYKKGRPQEANFDLLVYLDGEEKPTITMDMNDLFGGKRKPFVAPLVGRCGFEHRQSSYSYVPIGFQKSCKVVAVPRDPDEKLGWRDRDGKKRSHFIFFYQLTYRLCAPGVPVKAFTWELDENESRALTTVQSTWANAGKSPWPSADQDSMKSHTARAELSDPGWARLLDHAGGGTLRSLRLRITAGDNSAQTRRRLVEALWLDMTWDGAEKPQVSAPLGTFFAAPDSKINVRGLWLGCADGQYYCHLPMPFRRRAKIAVRLKQDVGAKVAIDAQFHWDPTPPHANDAMFHARRYDITKPPRGKNLLLLDARGRGHVVGVVADRNGDVESDDSWYIDGEDKPSILGTGTEDFFNFAWGLGDLQVLPMHGVRVPFGPASKRGKRTDTGVGYRFHLPAAYPFRNSLRLTWEHGNGNHDVAGRYSGVTYYYLISANKPIRRSKLGTRRVEP